MNVFNFGSIWMVIAFWKPNTDSAFLSLTLPWVLRALTSKRARKKENCQCGHHFLCLSSAKSKGGMSFGCGWQYNVWSGCGHGHKTEGWLGPYTIFDRNSLQDAHILLNMLRIEVNSYALCAKQHIVPFWSAKTLPLHGRFSWIGLAGGGGSHHLCFCSCTAH